MGKRHIVLEFNKGSDEWEWQIEELVGVHWVPLSGDDFAGQSDIFSEAASDAREAMDLEETK